eukprot:snap_masked-scaffold_24-processed-gene-1.17-mRNA-1 protein AED:1.00 eAED:1.00 QI:0/-1/0/0/-1/1/1/0/415
MEVKIPQLRYHTNEKGKNIRILSSSFHPNCAILATGGADSKVKFWKLDKEKTVAFKFDLDNHLSPVNCIRFSPCGKFLASAGDSGSLWIHRPKLNYSWNTVESSNHIQSQILRGHPSDIYSLEWSAAASYLLTGSIDSSIILWKLSLDKPFGTKFYKIIDTFRDHVNSVQGICFEQSNYLPEYFASVSSDRTLKIYTSKKSKKCQSRSLFRLVRNKKREQVDDLLPTFFRRLCFSDDGDLLFVPSTVYDKEISLKIYKVGKWKVPWNVLTGFDAHVICIKTLPSEKNTLLVATLKSIFIFATIEDKLSCVGYVGDVHLAQITDVSVFVDRIELQVTVNVTSSDGYMSFISLSSRLCEKLGVDFSPKKNPIPAPKEVLVPKKSKVEVKKKVQPKIISKPHPPSKKKRRVELIKVSE